MTITTTQPETIAGTVRHRVVVADDDYFVREGIISILSNGGHQIVEAAADARELRRAVALTRPDVVLTDIRMPPGEGHDGLRAAIDIRAAHPDVGVLVLSQHLSERFLLDLIGEHADGVGYLLKEKIAEPHTLLSAVQQVAAGGSALDADIIGRLVGRRRRSGPLDALTPRERDVLALMAEGHSNGGIAHALFVTTAAVERHVTGIFSKLHLHEDDTEHHRRVLAVLRYLSAASSASR